ncbi:uncharacterized protein LOC134833550 [Culicoides brevitarsis]|uniref:uncharacterized protein LOC134833550 n=1 Tax=Culicoides brevitarsis TaxID=469753 RepID=UPI00307BA913
MLEGWYCRATKAAEDEMGTNPSMDNNHGSENYKAKYRELKKKLKYLLYENEYFKESLKASQQQLLKVSRDRSYLLDRLLKYENPESELSDDDSDTSVEEPIPPPQTNMGKKRKTVDGQNIPTNKRPDGQPKRKYTKHKQLAAQQQQQQLPQPIPPQHHLPMPQPTLVSANSSLMSNNHHTNPILQDLNLNTEDVQRHLELKQFDTLDNVTMSVPQEMFSSESSNMEENECLSMGHETVETYMEN